MARNSKHPQVELSVMSWKTRADVAVARLDCGAIRERQAAMMRDSLIELAHRHRGRVTVDFGGVETVTAWGVAALVEVQRVCAQYGRTLTIFGTSKDVRKAFRALGAGAQLGVFQNEYDAVAAARSKRSPLRSIGFFGRLFGWRGAA